MSARWRNIFRCRPNSATRPSSCTPNQRPEANSWGALALLVSTSLLTPAAEAQEGGASFSVQAQSLSSALVDFAVQARVSIATPRAGLETVRAAGLHGAYAPEDALRRLLAGTGFTFERLDAVTFRIVPASSPSTPAEIAPAPPKEVVVTATRRPQSLARMAGSVTVIDRTALRLSGARGASDLPADAAGLTVTNVGPGRNKLIVRGMSDGAFSGNAQSTVGIYFDESRLTYGAPDPDLLLSDVEAVEILRGPQGMLYGAGAIAGLYHIVSHAPELNQRSAAVRASGEGGDSGEVGSDIELMYNQPLAADRAGLRLVAYREETPGWLNNAGVNQSNTNTTVRQGARATALIRFGGTWSLTMRALTQRIDSGDSQYAEAGLRLVRRTSILESNHTDFSLLNATVRGSIKTGEFTSTTSFSRHLLSGLSEAYGTVGTVAISPTSTAVYDDGRTNQAFDQEFRFTALASPTPWSIGMFISSRQRERTGSLFTNVLVRSAQYTLDRSDDAVEFAGYGDISFPFSEKWTLAIAGRASGTRLSTTGTAQAFPGSRSDDFSGKRTEWGVAPKASLSYEPRTGSLYYLTIANGYRTGGFNVGDAALLTAPTRDQPNREYAGDNVWTLEAGAKRSFFNQRVDMRAGAFWQDWINIQTDQLQVAGLPFTGNVGDGVSRGVELEANYRVSSDLSAHGFVRYTDSEVTNPNATFPVRANSRLPGVPNFMASASAQYDRPISANTHFLLSTQVLYVGRATQGFSAQNVTPIGGYTEVNLRTGLVGEKWSLTAFVNNAADAATATFAYGNPFLFGQSGTVTPLRPRSYGLELGRDF